MSSPQYKTKRENIRALTMEEIRRKVAYILKYYKSISELHLTVDYIEWTWIDTDLEKIFPLVKNPSFAFPRIGKETHLIVID
jgi:hypothetical protein